MKAGRAFARFWYELVVGDDWHVAAGLAVALALSALLVELRIPAWWFLPLAVVLLLAFSVWRGALATPAARVTASDS